MENKNDWKFLQEEVANIAREGLIRYGINPDTVTLADVEHNEKLRRLAMLSGAIVPKKTSISEDIEKANEDPILWYEYTEQQHRKCKVRGVMLIYAMFNDDKCRLTALQKDFVNRLMARIGDPLKVARVLYLGKLDATEEELLELNFNQCSEQEKLLIKEYACQEDLFSLIPWEEEGAHKLVNDFYHDGQMFTIDRWLVADRKMRSLRRLIF